ncbi:MAG TPA: hypothetical protein PLH34_08375, partial [Bacillota bacterium]|nr:hypothetical protein [Bacillota bacterium]
YYRNYHAIQSLTTTLHPNRRELAVIERKKTGPKVANTGVSKLVDTSGISLLQNLHIAVDSKTNKVCTLIDTHLCM